MRKLLILWGISCATVATWAQGAKISPMVVTVPDAVIAEMRTSHKPYNYYVTRHSKTQPITLLLPAGSTSNSVDLYLDKDYDQYTTSDRLHSYAIRTDTKFMAPPGEQLNLNLTSLADGNYIAVYSSCSYGGAMRISLMTE